MGDEKHRSADLRPVAGDTERRRWPRAVGALSLGRARLLPHLSHHYPSLRPNGWYKVMDLNAAALEPRARRGYLWIEVDTRLREVWAGHFEVRT